MRIDYGDGKTEHGPGVLVELTGSEVADAVLHYLASRGVWIRGPRTIRVNGEMCQRGEVYVDPSGSVTDRGEVFKGSGPE